MRPLEGVKVLDFSTLLPGPVCTLLLAEAGAEVTKVERPGVGDEMRTYTPRVGPDSVNFALLNRGKRSITIDLKNERSKVIPLVRESDVLVEQFRPGVMERLGLGYDSLRKENPRLIYCSITGYGQSGPRAHVAAHDLNYVAESGMLSLTEAPMVPAALLADIAGGAYPAMMNILLALRSRERDGQGCRLDISMSDNLFTFLYWALGEGALGKWHGAGDALVTGVSTRYQVYRTADDRFVAAAPLEDRFWDNFCAVLSIPKNATREIVAGKIREKTAEEWRAQFAGKDVCATIVATMQEALADPHVRARGIFNYKVQTDAGPITAVPVPVVDEFRDAAPTGYPRLGADN